MKWDENKSSKQPAASPASQQYICQYKIQNIVPNTFSNKESIAHKESLNNLLKSLFNSPQLLRGGGFTNHFPALKPTNNKPVDNFSINICHLWTPVSIFIFVVGPCYLHPIKMSDTEQLPWIAAIFWISNANTSCVMRRRKAGLNGWNNMKTAKSWIRTFQVAQIGRKKRFTPQHLNV